MEGAQSLAVGQVSGRHVRSEMSRGTPKDFRVALSGGNHRPIEHGMTLSATTSELGWRKAKVSTLLKAEDRATDLPTMTSAIQLLSA